MRLNPTKIKHTVFILAFFIFFQTHADESPLAKECQNNVSDSCVYLAQTLRLHDVKAAFNLTKKACELSNEDGCTQLYFDSLHLSTALQLQAFDIIKEKCSQGLEFCQTLANAYEDKKDFKKALLYSRKYYSKMQSGIYPYFEYKYGDKKIAFAAAKKDCLKKQGSGCAFYLRYMPDSPDISTFEFFTNSSCVNSKVESSGATDCNILGTYYYKKNKKDLALSLWSLDCNRNNLSACLLVLGSESNNTQLKSDAAHTFCKTQPQGMDFNDAQLRDQFCPSLKDSSRVPAGITDSATRLLKSYLEEQH
jgi:hypothetical protein